MTPLQEALERTVNAEVLAILAIGTLIITLLGARRRRKKLQRPATSPPAHRLFGFGVVWIGLLAIVVLLRVVVDYVRFS